MHELHLNINQDMHGVKYVGKSTLLRKIKYSSGMTQ